jgi:hypothetical protein
MGCLEEPQAAVAPEETVAVVVPAPLTPPAVEAPEAVSKPTKEATQKVVCWDGTEVEVPAWARLIGNKFSGKFHRLDCQYVPSRENHLYFKTRAEALAAGQVPCKVCGP